MKALVLVGIQNDFLSGGALSVPKGDRVILIINQLIPKFPLIVATKDWHPPDHQSFVTAHPGHKAGDIVALNGIEQVLWPVHCVQETWGAEFSLLLHQQDISAVFYKGTDPHIDSYSAFFDHAHQRSTGLADFLRSRGIDHIYLAGFATDYCVLYSAIDAMEEGFFVTVIEDASCGLNLKPGDEKRALKTMQEKGVEVLSSRRILQPKK